MSYLIQNRGEKKKHVFDLGSSQAVCGRPVKPGAEILDGIGQGELNLCEKCFAWIGKKMAYEYFGAEFFGSTQDSDSKRMDEK